MINAAGTLQRLMKLQSQSLATGPSDVVIGISLLTFGVVLSAESVMDSIYLCLFAVYHSLFRITLSASCP